ncbi:MAG: DUF1624 domain-containing protein [Betaproteobacteria bacterium]|nr:DUF1624 domain-containing protein [Betaproteobacteria bacterium]
MPAPGVLEQAKTARLGGLDSLRGLAIVWMMAFHFSFDLNWFGYIHTDFYTNPLWLWQRVCIVSLFLFSSGLAQAVGDARARGPRAFWRRWGQIFAAGLLVVLGSWLAFPASFIYFGILQGVAAMLLVHQLVGRRLGPWVLLLAPLAIAAPHLWADARFNPPWWNWTGLITRKPITEDYVPLLPWLGVFWLGAGAGALARRVGLRPLRALPRVQPLAWLGRWPLSIYLLHQPLLIGALWLVSRLLGHATPF